MKILVIEDESSLREIICSALIDERFVVESADCYEAAFEKINLYAYDCILLDIMLPDGNGLNLLNLLKEQKRTERILIVSARDSIDDKVLGLNLGADDYLAKPFHISELVARVRSLIRRNNAGENQISLGNVKMNITDFSVSVGGEQVDFGKKEYDILYCFMSRPNRMINKEVLAEFVWGDNIDQSENFDFIYAHMKNIRKKLKQYDATIEIKSVYGFGYKLIEL